MPEPEGSGSRNKERLVLWSESGRRSRRSRGRSGTAAAATATRTTTTTAAASATAASAATTTHATSGQLGIKQGLLGVGQQSADLGDIRRTQRGIRGLRRDEVGLGLGDFRQNRRDRLDLIIREGEGRLERIDGGKRSRGAKAAAAATTASAAATAAAAVTAAATLGIGSHGSHAKSENAHGDNKFQCRLNHG